MHSNIKFMLKNLI